METKTCTECYIVYPATKEYFPFYYKSDKTTMALKPKCRKCSNKGQGKYAQKHRAEKAAASRQYTINNRKTISEKKKEYYQEHKDELKIKRINRRDQLLKSKKEWRIKNKDKIKAQSIIYRQTHKAERRLRENNRRKNDPCFKMKCVLSRRLRDALKCQGLSKNGIKTMELVGCSIDFFKKHIESQFDSKMTWDNYGLYGWHVDHIIPCACFDLTDPTEQKQCFHYTNLRPLWGAENIKKNSWVGDKLYRKPSKGRNSL
jgi:hypothetical protein